MVQDAIFVLTKANQRAKQVATNAVANSTVSTAWRTLEWADTFKATVEGMVVRLLTIGKDGFYAWEKNPKLLNVIPEYIEEEAKQMTALQEDLLSISGSLRQAAEAIGQRTGSTAASLMSSAVSAAANEFKKDKGVAVTVVAVGAVVGLVALAYVWRAFK
jgi:hypothetical protein